MEQIVIQVEDKKKAKMLVELLRALDFVNRVTPYVKEEIKTNSTASAGSLDFFSLAGLWTNRKISLKLIRQKAWPRQ